jgi:hypothetical protein
MPAFAKVTDLAVANTALLRINGQRLQIKFAEVKVTKTYIVVLL